MATDLEDKTQGRIKIDIDNILLITSVLPEDEGHYYCKHGGEEKRGEVFLTVERSKMKGNWCFYIQRVTTRKKCLATFMEAGQ